ncbi:MAG: hypothetical protein WD226_09750 [Planctomycetota bacterium]
MYASPRALRRLFLAAPAPLAVALTAGLLGGCDDNIACVFSTGCVEGPGGTIGALSALRPEEDDWIETDPPEVLAAFPNGPVAATTPIVVIFDETVDPSTLDGALEARNVGVGTMGPPIPLTRRGTFGGGRVFVLDRLTLPGLGDAYTPGSYEVRFTPDASIVDITGQELADGGALLTTFSVVATPPAAPVLLTAYPLPDSEGASDVPELLFVFDRPMDAATVDADSIEIEVDGVDPAFDPDPAVLVLSPLGPVLDPRVFTWRSVDPQGDPVSLGASATIDVTLSPQSNPIFEVPLPGEVAASLPTIVYEFQTAPVPKPLGLSLLSMPTDAIGPTNLTPGDPEEFLLQVDLVAEGGDEVDLFVFGFEREPATPGDERRLIALRRTKMLPGAGPVGSVTFDAAEADLTESLMPLLPRFQDGGVSFAARLRRGLFVSPLAVLDVDPVEAGIQDPTLDVSGPEITDFLTSGGGTGVFVTDQRNLVLAGDAGEPVGTVEVSTGSGDNGVLPPVLATNGSLFLAAPVDLGGAVDGEVPFTAIAYDAAQNASAPIDGVFRQRGRVGPDAVVPGGAITVEVYDAATLEVVSGAVVSTHADDGATSTFLGSAVTDLLGRAVVTAAAGLDETIVTVDDADYDLWSLHGVTTSALSVPITPATATASARGTVELSDLLEVAFLSEGTTIADTRRGVFSDPLVPSADCTGGTSAASCAFGPFSVQPARIGAATFLAGDHTLTPATFDVNELLEGFELVLPLASLAPGAVDVFEIPVRGAFENPAFDESAEELFPGQVLQIEGGFTTGIDLGMLEDVPEFAGPVRVTPEGLVPGLGGSVPLGLGLSEPSGVPNRWAGRVGVGTSTRPGGFFAEALEAPDDPFVRAELLDMSGNLAVARRTESYLKGNAYTLFPASVPVLQAPLGTTAGASYDVLFDNTLRDVQAVTGFYSVRLTDSAGRGWTLWRPDPPDGIAQVRVAVPDLVPAGGAGLAGGPIDAVLSSVGVPALDAQDFLWSDLERHYAALSRSRAFTFDQP